MDNQNNVNVPTQSQTIGGGSHTTLIILWILVALISLANALMVSVGTGFSPLIIIFALLIPGASIYYVIKKNYKLSAIAAGLLILMNLSSLPKIIGSGQSSMGAIIVTLLIFALFITIFYISKSLYKKMNPGKRLF